VLRALRGKRSQVGFARRLGYRSNVPAAWEGGHRSPNAIEFFRVVARVGVDHAAAIEAFHPPAAHAFDPADPSSWLCELAGSTRAPLLAERSGYSVAQVRRWLSGRASPRLPQLLGLVDAATGRAGDFVASLVEVDALPSLAPLQRAHRAQRRLAFEVPWTAAVRTLLDARAIPLAGAARRIAAFLDAPVEAVEEAIQQLSAFDLVRVDDNHLVAGAPMTVDVRATAEDRRALRAHWSQVAANRIAMDQPDLFSFTLVSLSRADLQRVQQLQRAWFREVRGIVAASEPAEVAGLVIAHTAVWGEDS
jgi:DNA-binding transcriptional regulator YiaG